VGVETLLTLLEMAVQAPPSQFPAPEPLPSSSQMPWFSHSSLLSLEEARKVVFTQGFVKVKGLRNSYEMAFPALQCFIQKFLYGEDFDGA